MALTDALGNLIDFRLLPGQAHDLRGAATLIEELLADRAFDANWLREPLPRPRLCRSFHQNPTVAFPQNSTGIHTNGDI